MGIHRGGVTGDAGGDEILSSFLGVLDLRHLWGIQGERSRYELEVSEKFCPPSEMDPPDELQTTQPWIFLMLCLQITKKRAAFCRMPPP